MPRLALLHGAGYAGGALIRLVLGHPELALAVVTSRSMAGQPLHAAHPDLRGVTDLTFTDPATFDPNTVDAIALAAEHGQAAQTVHDLLEGGYDGVIVDLSADFRLRSAGAYPTWYHMEHPAPVLLGEFVYGLPEIVGPYPEGTRYVANPGCFATGLALALWPLATHLDTLTAHITAVTGASGSGTRPSAVTHFPRRDGNMRAYKVMRHQHLAEVRQTLGPHVDLHFVPVSGPWTHGIWGTIHATLPDEVTAGDVAHWYVAAYDHAACLRLDEGALPELRHLVGTPFCEVGWILKGNHLVVGVALDNLMKGAASQAVQNLNLLLGYPDALGLLPTARPTPAA
ncbi:MAG: N-acetyl-gamma-glutamyl-phosphate reductase [Bacteroidota bacterium]